MSVLIFYTLIFHLTFEGKILATSHLISRNEESLPYPSLPNSLPPIINWGADLIDGAVNDVQDLFRPPADAIPKKSPPITTPDSSLPLSPILGDPSLGTDASPPTTYHLTLPLPIPDPKECDSLNSADAEIPEECQIPTPKVIYPLDCNEDKSFGAATNQVITQALKNEVAKNTGRGSAEVDICTIPGCGVLFWTAELTTVQIVRILTIPGVRAIVTDQPIQSADDQNLGNRANEWSEDLTGRRRKKREVLVRDNEFRDLAFISTALGKTPLEQYHYFEEAGEEVTTYIVAEGFASHREVSQRKIKGWLFAKGATQGKSDASPFFTATCDISKLVGSSIGVANRGQVIVVKIDRTVTSFLSGLAAVAKDLEKRQNKKENTRGFTVLQSSMFWEDRDAFFDNEQHKATLRTVLDILIHVFQVPFVVPAGNHDEGYREINIIPAKFSTDERYPLIVVGAVNLAGKSPLWSMGGPALTITAPGWVQCAGFEGGEPTIRTATGTGLASVVTAGLAMYFLSIKEVLDSFPPEDNLAKSLRDYIVLNGYVRTDPDARARAIWNGLDPTRPNENYGWRV